MDTTETQADPTFSVDPDLIARLGERLAALVDAAWVQGDVKAALDEAACLGYRIGYNDGRRSSVPEHRP